jgi:signal transduction histidine kinase
VLWILVVEDSEDDTIILVRELRRSGYDVKYERVDSARSMRDALNRKTWDVIICDHALPGFDSFAALKIAKEPEYDLPFIIVSGKIDEEMAVEAMRAGANDYIMKDRTQRLGPAIEREVEFAAEKKRQYKAEKEQAQLKEQLRQAQKMEAIGQLAGGIAHDFNNALTVIVSYCSVLLKEIAVDNQWSSDVREIKNAADRAAALTQQLLAFSHKQLLRPEVLDLGSVVTELESVLSRLVRESIELKFHIDPAIHKIEADVSQLEQVVINLAVNARDAIQEAGEININVRNVALDEKARTLLGDLPDCDYVVISISDNGEGMDKETLSHIFEPFYTTKAVGKGTGLGLSTVFGVAKQSGGGVEVESYPGKGSEFRIYFPSVDELELGDSHKPNNLRTDSPEGRETILIVEDEDVILKILARTLTMMGYTILVASQGEEALSVAEQHRGRIDVMVTDIVMPKMGGYELAERLVAVHPETSVLYTTGYDEQMRMDQVVTDPQRQFIQKPFVPQEIAAKIRAILD